MVGGSLSRPWRAFNNVRFLATATGPTALVEPAGLAPAVVLSVVGDVAVSVVVSGSVAAIVIDDCCLDILVDPVPAILDVGMNASVVVLAIGVTGLVMLTDSGDFLGEAFVFRFGYGVPGRINTC
jgi:hypothetical protein